jgi:hypothetical protein
MNPLTLLAQAAESAGFVDKILSPQVLPIFIPIVAIIGGFAMAVTTAIIRHRERMAGVRPPVRDGNKCWR